MKPPIFSLPPTRLLALATLCLTGGALTTRANGEYDWQGGSGGNTWSLAANWQGGTSPVGDSSAVLFFKGGSNSTQPVIDRSFTISSINFGAANLFGGTVSYPDNYTIGSTGVFTSLTITNQDPANFAGLTIYSSAGHGDAETINCPVYLGNSQTWLFGSTTSPTVNFGNGINTGGYTLTLGNDQDFNFFYQSPAGLFTTINGVIGGTGGLTIYQGVFTLSASANSSYTGATSLTGGTLRLNNVNVLSTTSQVSFNTDPRYIYSSELIVGTTATLSKPISVTGAGTFSAVAGATFTLSGALTATSGPITLGFGSGGNTGTVVANFPLNGSSPGTFSISVNAGTLRNGNSTLGTFSAGVFSTLSTLTVAGGATYDFSGVDMTTGDLEGAGTISTATAALLTAGTGNFSGNLAGSLALTKTGTGTLTLSGANTFTGAVALNGGVLNAGSATALGSGGTITFAGGTLQYSAASSGTDFSSRFSSAANQPISLDTNGQNVTVGFGFGGNGTTLTKLGAGTLTINGANTYTGATNLNVGTVMVNNPGALGNGGPIVFNGGTLQYGDASRTDAQYNLADYSTRFSTAAGQVYNIDTGSHSIVYKAPLTSSGGILVKAGAGTLSLNGTNTYSGSTKVAAGTLLLNGANTGGGMITVDGTGATLGGTGGTTSAVFVRNGTLNPGGNGGAAGSAANVGTLSVGSLQFTNASLAVFDIARANLYDQLVSSGQVTLGGSVLSVTIDPQASFTQGQVLDLIHLTGGRLNGTFAGITNGGVYTFSGDPFQAVYTSTDFQLVAVPEPSTVLLVALPLLAGGASVWRRRGRAA